MTQAGKRWVIKPFLKFCGFNNNFNFIQICVTKFGKLRKGLVRKILNDMFCSTLRQVVCAKTLKEQQSGTQWTSSYLKQRYLWDKKLRNRKGHTMWNNICNDYEHRFEIIAHEVRIVQDCQT